jgi:hypothetical protein
MHCLRVLRTPGFDLLGLLAFASNDGGGNNRIVYVVVESARAAVIERASSLLESRSVERPHILVNRGVALTILQYDLCIPLTLARYDWNSQARSYRKYFKEW